MNRTSKWETALVLALFAGYYFLAIALVALLCGAILYVLPFSSGGVRLLLAALVTAAAWIIARSAIPGKQEFEVPGPKLLREEEPELFRVIDELAARLRVSTPDEVYVYNDFNAAVLNHGTFLGFGGKRALMIGLPLFGVLNIDELRSVLAHEFGHFAGQDTRLGIWVDGAYRSMCRTHDKLDGHGFWLSPLFRAYIRMYMLVVRRISRKREFRADEHSAICVGRQANLSVERRLIHWSAAYSQFWCMDAAPMFANGFHPPLLEGFRMFLNGPDSRVWIDDALAIVRRRQFDPYSTHPATEERIAAFEAMPDDGIAMDTRPASRLLRDEEAIEQQVIEFEFGRAADQDNEISWEDVGVAYMHRWERHIEPHLDLLARYTLSDVPRLFRDPDLADWHFAGAGEADGFMPREDFLNAARGVLLSAAALAMVRAGWHVEAKPGRELMFRTPSGVPTTAPWQILGRMAEPGGTDTEWLATIARGGLSQASLAGAGAAAAA